MPSTPTSFHLADLHTATRLKRGLEKEAAFAKTRSSSCCFGEASRLLSLPFCEHGASCKSHAAWKPYGSAHFAYIALLKLFRKLQAYRHTSIVLYQLYQSMTRPIDRSINLPIYLTDATSRNVMGQVHLPTYTYIRLYGIRVCRKGLSRSSQGFLPIM